MLSNYPERYRVPLLVIYIFKTNGNEKSSPNIHFDIVFDRFTLLSFYLNFPKSFLQVHFFERFAFNKFVRFSYRNYDGNRYVQNMIKVRAERYRRDSSVGRASD